MISMCYNEGGQHDFVCVGWKIVMQEQGSINEKERKKVAKVSTQ